MGRSVHEVPNFKVYIFPAKLRASGFTGVPGWLDLLDHPLLNLASRPNACTFAFEAAQIRQLASSH